MTDHSPSRQPYPHSSPLPPPTSPLIQSFGLFSKLDWKNQIFSLHQPDCRTMEQLPGFMKKRQPLTPLSPSLPTSLPHVCEPIPQLPLTPPDGGEYLDTAANEEAICTALHVLSTERDALTHLGSLYESDPVAQEGFVNAVNTILKTVVRCGKLVVCGVGKSGKIGLKVVATMNSFGIRSTFLHPTEALHGDLGMIGAVSRHSFQSFGSCILTITPRTTQCF